MKILKYILFFVLILSGIKATYAQDINGFLLGIYFKREQAIEKIRQLEIEINKNKSTISQSQTLIDLSRQKGNKEAEKVALEALQKAKESLKKNEESLNRWKTHKIMLDHVYTSLQNEINNKNIKGVTSYCSGRVDIFKANGDKVSCENGLLEPGDMVWTYDGTAKIEMLGGRGTTTVGPWSIFKMRDDSEIEQIWELIKGKIHMTIEKIKESIRSRRVNIRTVEAVCAVRGTEFYMERKEDILWLYVIDGSVEVKGIKDERMVEVFSGYRIRVTKDGLIGEPEKINLKDVERWWEG
ncbi:MAG TPA: FecR domain-containing protein [Syntrophorhabdaceae bacterium]|nr:FecR domain-containing protein [Syntrophorhabdaceae bacterium]